DQLRHRARDLHPGVGGADRRADRQQVRDRVCGPRARRSGDAPAGPHPGPQPAGLRADRGPGRGAAAHDRVLPRPALRRGQLDPARRPGRWRARRTLDSWLAPRTRTRVGLRSRPRTLDGSPGAPPCRPPGPMPATLAGPTAATTRVTALATTALATAALATAPRARPAAAREGGHPAAERRPRWSAGASAAGGRCC